MILARANHEARQIRRADEPAQVDAAMASWCANWHQPMSRAPVTVVFLHRRPRGHGNFSIENIFETVRSHLPQDIVGVQAVASFESQGLWRRVYIMLEATLRQGDVNHVTGDVHFLTFFLRKRRTVLTVHDVGFLDEPSWLNPVRKLLWLTVPAARAQVLTTVSQATKDTLLSHLNCDPAKIEVIPVPISKAFRAYPAPFNKHEPVILQVGCARNKNLERLVESLKGISCRLEFIGRLPESIERRLEHYGMSYHFSYNLPESEVVERYRSADIVTLISSYEGFGMPILEGNAIGRPVITSNRLSMPEVAGDAACLVDPLDVEDMRRGFLKIIQDDAYRESLISNGYRNCERFKVDDIVDAYCVIYRRLAQTSTTLAPSTHGGADTA